MCDISIEDAVYFILHWFGSIAAEMGIDGVNSAADLPLKTDRVAVLMLFQPVQPFLMG